MMSTKTVKLHCKSEQVKKDLELVLCGDGIRTIDSHNHDVGSNYTADVVVDFPWGIAFPLLEELVQCSGERDIVTAIQNPCPEYLLDLLDFAVENYDEKRIQVFNTIDSVGLKRVLQDLPRTTEQGLEYKTSPLTTAERQTLQDVAKGYSARDIAIQRQLSHGTIRNRVTTIYSKLNLSSGVQLAHYYLGQWFILLQYHKWVPPAHLLQSSTKDAEIWRTRW